MDVLLLTNLIIEYRYLALIPGALLAGPWAGLLSGVLLRLEIFTLVPTALSLMAGELLGDVLWYWLGARYGERVMRTFGKHFGISEVRVLAIKKAYHSYHDWIIFGSKVTTGLGVAPLIFFTAGFSGVPFRRYMIVNLIGQIIWTTLLLSIGFFLGSIYVQIGTVLDRIFFAAASALAILCLLLWSRQLARRFHFLP